MHHERDTQTDQARGHQNAANPALDADRDAAAIDAASRSLFQFARFFARRPLRDQVAGDATAELSAVLVVQTVEHAQGSGTPATVGLIAAELGIDPSTASRLVAQTVRAGYLERSRDARDGRTVRLGLTAHGESLAAAAAAHQRAVFDALTREWSAAERAQFARQFVRFAAAAAAAMLAEQTAAESPADAAPPAPRPGSGG